MRRLLLCLSLVLLPLLLSAAEDVRHPLTRALDYDANLLVASDLRLTNRQLLEFLSASRAAQQAVAAYDAAQEQALRQLQALRAREREALATGQPVPEDVATQITEARQKRQIAYEKLLGDVGSQIRLVRRSLSPQQARLVDWAPPAEASASDDDEAVLEELRLLGANLAEATRMIERIRYLIASDYSITRIGRVEEYLRGHMRPGTPQFEQTRDWLLGLLDEVRVVKEDDWPQQAPLYASQVLQRLGLLRPRQRPVMMRANYNWWDMYYLLVDPQSPQMLQAMVQARGNVAGDEE